MPSKEEIEKALAKAIYSMIEKDSTINQIAHQLYNEIFQIINIHKQLVEYSNGDSSTIIEIKKITSDKKKYIPPYIEAFKKTQQMYIIANNYDYANSMQYNIYLFEMYLNDKDNFLKIESSINTTIYSTPNYYKNINIIKNKSKKSEKDKKILQQHQTMKYILSVLKFFTFTHITERGVWTSMYIYLYKEIMKKYDIKKYTLKDIIETLSSELGEKRVINPDKVDKAYIKTKINNLLIYAFPSSKDIPSLYNFDEIEKILNEKIAKKSNNPMQQAKIERYLECKISPLKSLIT